MNKYLFFRTDRIGDFLLSSILINSIKRNDPKAYCSVVCSDKNYDYVKNFHLVDEAILFPKKNIFKRIRFYFLIFLKKNYCTIVCDGKKKSIFCAILIKSKIKILFCTKNIYSFFFKFSFNKILLDSKAESKISEICHVINYLNFKYDDKDLHSIKINSNKEFYKNINFKAINQSSFNLFHLDEKWIFNSYIKSYKNIEPSVYELKQFISELILISKKNLIITCGTQKNILINTLIKDFTFLTHNTYFKKINSQTIFLFIDLNFFELEYIVSKSKILIASHGSISHVAASFGAKIIDIIDDSETIFFFKWSNHFKNYKKIFRKNFNLLQKDIFKSL